MKKFLYTIAIISTFGLFLEGSEALALTVSPPIKELGGDPGTKVQGIMKLYNETNEAVMVYPSILNFKAKNEGTGEPVFTDLEDPENARDLATWIKVADGPFTINPLDWQNIIFDIDIPADAEPGGHYAAVFFGPNQAVASQDGTVSVDFKAGMMVLLTVTGEVDEKGVLKSFLTKLGKKFYEYIPVTLEVRIENQGNVHFRPGGGIQIKNMLDKKVAELPIVETDTGGNVLPGSTRRYDLVWGEKDEKKLPKTFLEKVQYEWNNFRIGKFQAAAVIGLPQGQGETMELSFWIVPWQLLLVIFVLLLAVYFLFRWYNRWIIRKARAVKE